MSEINELVIAAHTNAVIKGFYETDKNIGEMLMLIVSELGEALEAHRTNNFANKDHVDFYLKEEYGHGAFKRNIKNTFEDEIADVFIRLFDLCGYLKINIDKHIKAKMKYNAQRDYKHGKQY